MSKGNKLEFKQALEYKEAASYLEDLVTSFKSGKIVVQKGEEVISLSPSGTVEIEIEARVKKEKGKFSMEISWKEPECSTDDFSISSTEPEIAEPKPEKEEDQPEEPAEPQKKMKAAEKGNTGKKSKAEKKASGQPN